MFFVVSGPAKWFCVCYGQKSISTLALFTLEKRQVGRVWCAVLSACQHPFPGCLCSLCCSFWGIFPLPGGEVIEQRPRWNTTQKMPKGWNSEFTGRSAEVGRQKKNWRGQCSWEVWVQKVAVISQCNTPVFSWVMLLWCRNSQSWCGRPGWARRAVFTQLAPADTVEGSRGYNLTAHSSVKATLHRHWWPQSQVDFCLSHYLAWSPVKCVLDLLSYFLLCAGVFSFFGSFRLPFVNEIFS